MFIKANENLINTAHIVEIVINWSDKYKGGYITILGQNLKAIDKIIFQDKEKFDKYMKYLNNRLSYELDIISELEDIKSNLDSIAMM